MISQILNGKRHISLKSAMKIVERLSLSPNQRAKFLISAVGEDAASSHISTAKSRFYDLEIDRFRVISDWTHFAILALEKVNGSQWDAGWLAERLNISLQEAKEAMQRLERLGLVKIVGKSFQQSSDALHAKSPIPEKAIQSYHRQTLEKAMNSLTNEPIGDREFNALTIAVNSEMLETIRKLIAKFMEDMFTLLDDSKDQDRVYTLAVQFFPISCK